MKALPLVLFLAATALMSGCVAFKMGKEDKIVGKWESIVPKDEQIKCLFDKNHRLTFEQPNDGGSGSWAPNKDEYVITIDGNKEKGHAFINGEGNLVINGEGSAFIFKKVSTQ